MANNQLIDKILAKVGSLFVTSSGETWNETYFPTFGVITNGGASMDIFVDVGKVWSTVTITKVLSEIRPVSGGYVGGAIDTDITAYYEYTNLWPNGWMRMRFTKTGGWGFTNNTPVTGVVRLSGTVKGGVKPRVSSFFNWRVALPERGCA